MRINLRQPTTIVKHIPVIYFSKLSNYKCLGCNSDTRIARTKELKLEQIECGEYSQFINKELEVIKREIHTDETYINICKIIGTNKILFLKDDEIAIK
jgi:hypothetical protein